MHASDGICVVLGLVVLLHNMVLQHQASTAGPNIRANDGICVVLGLVVFCKPWRCSISRVQLDPIMRASDGICVVLVVLLQNMEQHPQRF